MLRQYKRSGKFPVSEFLVILGFCYLATRAVNDPFCENFLASIPPFTAALEAGTFDGFRQLAVESAVEEALAEQNPTGESESPPAG